MARLIMRSTCAFGLLVLVGLSGAATAATPAQDPLVIPPVRRQRRPSSAWRAAGRGRTSATDCAKAAGSCATRTSTTIGFAAPSRDGVPPRRATR